MSTKILFVDDEQSLLNGIERRLSFDYDLVTANSGANGLTTIDANGPFAVIVTDMRMPNMDGIEFVKQARKKSPDSVYIMLTGNQDQATATQAVNEGQVFRFLNKPCQSEHLRNALDTALRQYRLVTGEKELLHQTFCGAIGVLTDVLELTHPGVFFRSASIQEIVSALQVGVGFEDRWEYKLAAKLSLIGFALVHEQERIAFESAAETAPGSTEWLRMGSSIGGRLIEKIPRLGVVAAMIGGQADVDGGLTTLKPSSHEDLAATGATLLRLSLHIDHMARQGMSAIEGIREIHELLPGLSKQFENAIKKAWPDRSEQPIINVKVSLLKEGMVLARDVTTGNGAILLREGRRLTVTIIEKLRCYDDVIKGDHLVKVYEPTLNILEGQLASV